MLGLAFAKKKQRDCQAEPNPRLEACERRQTNQAHRTRSIGGKAVEFCRAQPRVVRKRMGSNENQVRPRALGALEHEVRPVPLLVQLRAAANAAIGAPLTLLLEKLTFLPETVFQLTPPATDSLTRRWLRQATVTAGPAAAVAGNEHDLAVARPRDERGEPYEFVARRSQIGDRKNSGTHDVDRHLMDLWSKGCATAKQQGISSDARRARRPSPHVVRRTHFLRQNTRAPNARSAAM